MGFFKDLFSVKDGTQKTYHSNGQLKTEKFYIDGIRDGHWETYNKNGLLISLSIYHYGKLIESTKNSY